MPAAEAVDTLLGSQFPLGMCACLGSGRAGTDTGATGSHDLARGVRCHLAKLLLDPTRGRLPGPSRSGPRCWGYSAGGQGASSGVDSAASAPRSPVVAGEPFDWRDAASVRRPYADTVIYEVRVKGFTMAHPACRPNRAGPTPDWLMKRPSPTWPTLA